MKKEITEYEAAESTNTKIKCASCDETWDNRGVRGKDGVTTVVLDAKIARKGYSNWSEKSFDRMLIGDDRHKITGEAIEDFCASCWDAQFDQGPAIEVEEPEYYVEEETREEYLCDFCGESMGDEPDHKVSVNPRIKNEPRNPPGMYEVRREERTPTVLTYDLDDPVSKMGSRDDLTAERDEALDTCHGCAVDTFNLGVTEGTKDTGIAQALVNSTIQVATTIKDAMLLRDV